MVLNQIQRITVNQRIGPHIGPCLQARLNQRMRVLKLGRGELLQLINEEQQSNPLLEERDGSDDADSSSAELVEGDAEAERAPLKILDNADGVADFERLRGFAEYLGDEERAPHKTGGSRESDSEMDALSLVPAPGVNLLDHLLDQWRFVEASESVRRAGRAIINAVEPDGYLRIDLEYLAARAKTAFTMEDLQEALQTVHRLEPVGVGARDLRECFLLQLDALANDTKYLDLQRKLVSDYWGDLQRRRYKKIALALACSVARVHTTVLQLEQLHAHPGRQIGPTEAEALMPDADIQLDARSGRYIVHMCRDPAKNLYLSSRLRKLLLRRDVDPKTRTFLQSSLSRARDLIENVGQRHSTLLRVLQVVVEAQVDFLREGSDSQRPLSMADVARALGVGPSVVSRAVSDKWVQTPSGIFPLCRFFSRGIPVSEGSVVARDAVMQKMRAVIVNESGRSLGDAQIAKDLLQQGITISRRTVAKYRKLLHIPSAKQREASLP